MPFLNHFQDVARSASSGRPMPKTISSPAMPAAEPMPTSRVPRYIRTRRNLWLSTHSSYYEQPSHALSLPLAYDRLVRAYQSPAERQAEGQSQGWAKMLEGALVRGEAKRDLAVKTRRQEEEEAAAGEHPAQQGCTKEEMRTEQGNQSTPRRRGLKALPEELGQTEDVKEAPNGIDDHPVSDTTAASRWDVPLGIVPAGELLEASPEPLTGENRVADDGGSAGQQTVVEGLGKAQASGRWHELLRARFVAGADEEFEYGIVDDDAGPELDWQEARRQDAWFEDEGEAWSDDGTERGRRLQGETGVQDF